MVYISSFCLIIRIEKGSLEVKGHGRIAPLGENDDKVMDGENAEGGFAEEEELEDSREDHGDEDEGSIYIVFPKSLLIIYCSPIDGPRRSKRFKIGNTSVVLPTEGGSRGKSVSKRKEKVKLPGRKAKVVRRSAIGRRRARAEELVNDMLGRSKKHSMPDQTTSTVPSTSNAESSSNAPSINWNPEVPNETSFASGDHSILSNEMSNRDQSRPPTDSDSGSSDDSYKSS